MKNILFIAILLFACTQKKDPPVQPKQATDTAIADPKKDTAIKQEVVYHDNRYWLQTYMIDNPNTIHPFPFETYLIGNSTTFPLYKHAESGSFNYIKSIKKAEYQKAADFIKDKAANEKAIADSLAILQSY